MPNAASLSAPSAAALSPLPLRSREAPAFSFDDAVAGAERKAARALDIHGGTPARPVTPAGTRPESALQGDAGAAKASRASANPEEATAPSAPTNTAPASKHASRPSVEVIPAATATGAGIATAAASPARLQPANTAPAAIRDAITRVKAEAPRTPTIVRAPLAARQFAEILAQRLDNASQFDLRLDPPSFGSIDGRLTLSDDGRAVLSLAFDNQNAFDHFRRDEAALRAALADGGFDLAQQDLQFSFRAPEEGPATEPRRERTPETVFSPTSRHRGAIDIRA